MPLIDLRVNRDSKWPVVIFDKNDRDKWWHFTVDQFLGLSVEQAKAEDGTAFALMMSRTQHARPRIPQSEVDRAVDQFLSSEDNE